MMLRLGGSEQEFCLQPPKQWFFAFSLSSLDCTQSPFFFFSGIKIMALDDMTSGIDLRDES